MFHNLNINLQDAEHTNRVVLQDKSGQSIVQMQGILYKNLAAFAAKLIELLKVA